MSNTDQKKKKNLMITGDPLAIKLLKCVADDCGESYEVITPDWIKGVTRPALDFFGSVDLPINNQSIHIVCNHKMPTIEMAFANAFGFKELMIELRKFRLALCSN